MSLFNLIVHSELPRRKEYIEEFVRLIIDRFPCRIFWVYRDNNTRVIHSKQSSRESNQDLISEVIEVHGTDEQIPNLIYPDLIPDLPVYLVWGENPNKEDVLLDALLAISTRAIFDSETAQDIVLFCSTLSLFTQTHHVECLDTNWVRTRGWRIALSQVFCSKERLEQLKRCELFRITYNSTCSSAMTHATPQSFYLQAWLTAQLGVTLQSELIPEKNDAFDPCSILKVEIKSGQHAFELAIQKGSSLHIAVHISTEEACDVPLMIPLPRIARTRAFLKHLFYGGMSTHFQNTLQTIAKMPNNAES